MATFIRCLFALELNDVSFLYTLHYFVCGGGYRSLASNDHSGGQFQRMREGSMTVSEYIVSRLRPGSVLLSNPVSGIVQDSDTNLCTVTTRPGGVFTAKTVISAIPSPLYTTIRWSPALPIEKRCLAQRAFMGNCTKVVLIYSSAWWRKAGFSGLAMSLVGPICQTMDTSDGIWNSEDPALQPRQFSLSCFPMGQLAVEYAKIPSREARVQAIKDHVARLYPGHEQEAMDTTQVFEQQWMEEEFSQGAPCPVYGCGALTSVGREWKSPHGRVFFAGTEMATIWKGYMDGAVSAGCSAARQAITVLAVPEKTSEHDGVKASHATTNGHLQTNGFHC